MDFEIIHPGLLDKYADREDVIIIDLREPKEYREKHIRGAVNIPYSRLEEAGRLPKDQLLVLYCERGSASLSAAKTLARQGYRVKSVAGGLHAYRGNMAVRY